MTMMRSVCLIDDVKKSNGGEKTLCQCINHLYLHSKFVQYIQQLYLLHKFTFPKGWTYPQCMRRKKCAQISHSLVLIKLNLLTGMLAFIIWCQKMPYTLKYSTRIIMKARKKNSHCSAESTELHCTIHISSSLQNSVCFACLQYVFAAAKFCSAR